MDTKVLVDKVSKEKQWELVETNILAYKNGDSFSIIHPNVSSYGIVAEWKCENFRVTDRVRIEGASFYSTGTPSLKKAGQKEVLFLSKIIIPE